MRKSCYVLILSALGALALLVSSARAADPGLLYPPGSEINDQKTGSVLIYNFYTSGATPATENSRISLTNYSTNSAAFVRIFFVNGASGLAINLFICLNANQTKVILASDVDPGVKGYIIAVAVSGVTGCPLKFNFLSGSAYVKLATGHSANFSAESVTAIADPPTSCVAGATTATLNFNGTSYNQLPRLLAADKIRSPSDNNALLLILNRIGGNLSTGMSTLGTINGELFNDMGNSFPFTFAAGTTQRVQVLSNTFPVTSPVFSSVIPAGRTGWMTLNSASDIGLLGALINFNPNTATSATAFNGGHNLRKLTLSTTNSITLPVAPPMCYVNFENASTAHCPVPAAGHVLYIESSRRRDALWHIQGEER
jgi:hypothetical protein